MPKYYSGCNFTIGGQEKMLFHIGEALAMHECGDCEWLLVCPVKKDKPIWRYVASEDDAVLDPFIEFINQRKRKAREAEESRENERRAVLAKVEELRHLIWMADIPHPKGVPEYVELHERILKFLKFIDTELLKVSKEGEE